MSNPDRTGLILFAHGARDPRWAQPFEATRDRLAAARPALDVRLAFLELMSPSLPEAGDALAAAGCRHIVVQPMFLGTGGHVRRDLPLLLDGLRARHPAVTWQLEPPIGEHPDVLAAMCAATLAALSTEGASPPA